MKSLKAVFSGRFLGFSDGFFKPRFLVTKPLKKVNLLQAPAAGDSYVRMLQTEEELAKRIGEKANQVGFDTVIRILAASDKGENRCDDILNNLFVAFNVTKDASSNWFQARRLIPIDFINSPILHDSMDMRQFQFGEKTSLLTPEELASLFHFPNSRYNYSRLSNGFLIKFCRRPPI